MNLIGIIYEKAGTKAIPWYLLLGISDNMRCFRLSHFVDDYEVDIMMLRFYESMESVDKEYVETY